jgi:pimeloyl-ACP methyl ester carboxylesterase
MKVISSSLRAVGSGPTVVLLHSSGSSGRQWETLSARMRARYRVVTVDAHGHGMTPEWPSDRPLRLEDDMALTEPLFGAAGRIHLVGHSYGGVLALKLALKHSSRVASVAVFEPVFLRLLVDFNQRDLAAISITRAAQSRYRPVLTAAS